MLRATVRGITLEDHLGDAQTSMLFRIQRSSNRQSTSLIDMSVREKVKGTSSFTGTNITGN
ncbi:hypothetical protein SAY87_024498 [Trapa incisa]|uniref:Uncharacterized protein n=1 Tax=Trapa incisa TaxID=236973 RepID=A0AAN7GEG7_9MYRT|nr:hypothetical protein SAY87_024498 [Trapa incisa]